MGSIYIHEQPDWPQLHWQHEQLAEPLGSVRHRQGRLIGHMEAIGAKLQGEGLLQTLTADVLNSSEIEGERLNAEQVRSSVARRLGIDIGALKPADRNVDGMADLVLDATGHYDRPLTAERLFAWNASLFPGGPSGLRKVQTGAWRNDATDRCRLSQEPCTHPRFTSRLQGQIAWTKR